MGSEGKWIFVCVSAYRQLQRSNDIKSYYYPKHAEIVY
jgi:hypothetical protein